MAKPISPVDLDFLVVDSKIPLDLIPVEMLKFDPFDADLFQGFKKKLIGFIQIPTKDHGRLFTHCQLSKIGFVAKNGLSYVPVFVFHHEEAFFDNDVYSGKPFDHLPWVVLYLGNDDCSYGRRFKSEFDTRNFIKNGFKNGFCNVVGKLDFYNS